eukprot:1207215-Pyramimonas_sp.AAC.1
MDKSALSWLGSHCCAPDVWRWPVHREHQLLCSSSLEFGCQWPQGQAPFRASSLGNARVKD